MMNRIFLIFVLLLSFQLFSQIEGGFILKDTVEYYKNGQVKEILGIDRLSTYGAKLRVLYDSVCNYTIGDKLFEKEHITGDVNGNYSRRYYKDSLVIVRMISNTYDKDKIFTQIYFNLKKDKPVEIFFLATRDSLVTKLQIGQPTKNTYSTARSFDYKEFKTPTSLSNLELTSDNRYFRISFYEKYYINEIVYKWLKDDNKDSVRGTYISFYKGNLPKEYGQYIPPIGRMGKWYTYHKNGKLASEGNYCGNKVDKSGNEYDIKKIGHWIYYSNEGCIEKEETWDNGVLIEPQPPKAKKSPKPKRKK